MKSFRSSKKHFILILYLIITSCVIQIYTSQKERWDSNDDFEPVKNFETLKNFGEDFVFPDKTLCSAFNSIEYCEEEHDNNMQLSKRQPLHNSVRPSLISSRADKSIRTVPIFQTGQSLGCSCGMESRVINLGINSYPRYVQTAVCKADGCSKGRCHPKKYKVHVLKQKQMEDLERTDLNSGLPDILKDLFLPETITVTVACECVP